MTISFPDNPSVGELHTNNHGQSYKAVQMGDKIVWQAIGGKAGETRFSVGPVAPIDPKPGDLWHDTLNDIIKMWDRKPNSEQWAVIGTKPVVSTTTPTDPLEGMLWFNPNELNLYMYIIYDGSGKWKILASASLTDTQTIISEVLPLTWEFSDKRFNFELFTDNKKFNFRDIQRRPIIEAIAGDDTLEISSTDGIETGDNYVLYHPDQGVLDIVRVNGKLSSKRLKLQAILAHSYGAENNGIVGAYLSPTSFSIQPDSDAIVRNGDIFYTRPLNALEIWPSGQFAIRRSAQGTGQFAIAYKYPDQNIWNPAALMDTRGAGPNWRDELYEINTTGIIDMRISYANSDVNATETIDFMVLFGAPDNSDSIRMERPKNENPIDGASGILATPTLTLSTYRNIFGIPQGGAQFQVALDPSFNQLVVNTSSDDLVAWVGVSGQSANFNAITTYDERKFVMVGDGGIVRRSTDGGLTFTSLSFPNSQNIKDIDFNNVDQLIVCGANGLIANSQNNGDSWVVASPANAYTGTFGGVAASGSVIVAVGTGAEIQVSNNGGSIFNKRTAPNSYAGDYRGADMSDANILIVGTLGQIAFSSTNGANFTKRTPANGFAGAFNAVAMRNDGHAIVVGANGEVQRTEDYGANFQKIALPDNATTELKSVAFHGDNVLIVGANGSIYTSDDAGISFVLRPAGSGSTATFNAAALDAGDYGLIAGAGGVVQHTLRLEGVIGASYTVPAGADMLQINKVYWWRGKYIDELGFESDWSIPTAFSTSSLFAFVHQPQNLSPANGAVNVPIPPKLQITAFKTFGSDDTHTATVWEIATDAGFTNLIYNSGDKTVDKLSIDVPGGLGMTDQGLYYWRAKQKGATLGYSAWSVPTSFRAVNSPAAPTITSPTEGATGVSPTVLLTSTAFSTTATSENHASSQWQISTNAQFTNIVHDSGQVANLTSYPVPADVLQKNTQYFARVRHFGLNTGASNWSGARSFTTSQVAKPALNAPANGATFVSTTPTLTSSAFTSSGTEAHTRSQWQISANSDFTNIVYDSGETTNLLSHTVPAGSALTGQVGYYARVRHRGANSGLSDWSNANQFTTGQASTPSITAPSAESTGNSVKPTLTSSNFNSSVPGDTHVSSSWQIATDNTFTNIVASVANATNNKLSWESSATLAPNTQYFARVRHHGSASGPSNWSAASRFVTALANAPTLTSPASGAVVQTTSPTLTSTNFSSPTTESHQSSQWQIATDSSFNNLVVNSGEVGNLTSYNSPALGYNTQYYARVRHRGSLTGWTNWSPTLAFSTLAAAGEAVYTTPGTYTFTVPSGVTSVCVVTIGGGGNGGAGYNDDNGSGGGVKRYGQGGGGGGLRYLNNIAVTPGSNLSITVGGIAGSSSFGGTIIAYGGANGAHASGSGFPGGGNGAGGGGVGGSGGNGGNGTVSAPGSAGGYSSNGASGSSPSVGSGLYGGGGNLGRAGVGGSPYNDLPAGASTGTSGGVRVIWGAGRSFPNAAS